MRDRLMGRGTGTDIDLAVKGDAVALGRELADSLGGSPTPLSVPRGMMRIVVAGNGRGGRDAGNDDESKDWSIDLTGYDEDIEKDLARRDFTINAMAVPLEEWPNDDFGNEIIDPFGGRSDLFRKTIRATNPDIFEDDPGRLLRAVRLSGDLGMRVEPDTVRLVIANAKSVRSVSPPRVREEFLKIMAPPGAKGRVEVLDRLGLLQHVIPELMATKGVEQPRMHYWDVWGHSLHTVEAAEG